ncbi:MAG TPA: hypothetical protein VGA60_09690 [Kiloniellales bacterium]|jgi:hypothetical protein
MAGKSNPPNTAAPKGAGKGKLSGRTIGTFIILMPVIAVLMPSCILLALNLAPTLVAFAVDRTREKYLTITVGLLNLSGSLPAILRLWTEGQTYEVALRVAGDPFNLLIAYGTAAIGCSIYLTLPIILSSYYARMTTMRLRILQDRQDTLNEAWGDEIAGERPPRID